jgi:pimeloyl-ACP methyl ester carboxylesterase
VTGEPPLALSDRGRGPVAVLLHGQPGEGRDWEAVARRLMPDIRVIVPDRPGYGRTPGPAVGIAENAELIVAMLDRLEVSKAVIAGHSWGGAVALELALGHQDRVSALVLAGSVGGKGSVDWFDHLLAMPVIGTAMSLVGLSVLRMPPLGRIVAGLAAPTAPDLVKGFATGWYRSWRSFVIEQRALVTEMPRITDSLGKVGVPAVVIAGTNDRLVRPRSQLALADALPHARLVRIGGVGHIVPREAPDKLAEVILAMALGQRDAVDPGPGQGPGSATS